MSEKTGIHRQMIGRLEKGNFIPSIPQLEKLSEVLGFEVTDMFVEMEPTIYTAFRQSGMSAQEKEGVDRMFEMMMASRQQLLLRKAMTNEQR